MVLEAVGDRRELVVVGQSLGGFVAPLVAERRPVELLVLLNAMVPRPGETDWWAATGHPVQTGPDLDPVEVFLHDVPDAVASRGRRSRQSAGADTDARAAAARALARRPDALRAGAPATASSLPTGSARVVRDRLGIEPDEMDGGHCVALSRPRELVALLESLRASTAGVMADRR